MADGTHISWADATWNVITGCAIKSPACASCYAMKLAGTRLRHTPSRIGLTIDTKAGPVWNGEVRFNEQWLDQPLRWRAPRDVFVIAHGDLFYERVPIEWQHRINLVMRRATQHRMLVLTKRPEIMFDFMSKCSPMPHIWLGVSIEDQTRADERHDALEALAAFGWNTWVSYEPALGPVDWHARARPSWSFIRWLVSGGESDSDGKSARPSHPDWHRAALNFCAQHGIPYHFKQRGSWTWDDLDLSSGSDEGALEVPLDWRSKPDRFLCLRGDGQRVDGYGGSNETFVARVGKKAAGAMLDGREWRQMPGRASP